MNAAARIWMVGKNSGNSFAKIAGALSLALFLSVVPLLANPPEVTGQWDFDQGDLRATVGTDLEYVQDTQNITAFPWVTINGQPARVMAFGSNSVTQGFYLRHGASPNGGGEFVNQYTLIMDVMYPAQSTDQWRALFQTDPFNHLGNDAEFYAGNEHTLPDAGGIGTENLFNGHLLADTWYRIAFAVDLTAQGNAQLTKYINGTKVASQPLSGGVDGRYALGPTALLFTAGMGSGGLTPSGFVNSIQFVNGCMDAASIAALGGPVAAGIPPGDAVVHLSIVTNRSASITLNCTGGHGPFQFQKATRLVNPDWQDISTAGTNRIITVSTTDGFTLYRVREIRPDIQIGQLASGEEAIPTAQILRAAGRQVQFNGRPVDLVLSPNGNTVFIKNQGNLLALNATNWYLYQSLAYPTNGASMHGIAMSKDGAHVYVTSSGAELFVADVAADGSLAWSRTIVIPGYYPDPTGLAISPDGTRAYICAGRINALSVVDLASGTVTQQIPVGIAPWDVVLSPDGTMAYVSDWGGRYPGTNDLTADSAGTRVVVDNRGIAASGMVSFVDLIQNVEIAQVPTGLHPSDLELSPDGATLYVANANSDTVTVINTSNATVRETILARPDPTLPYGSAPNALALGKDGTTLFVALAGNNAVARFELPNAQHTNSLLQGCIPTDWYPAGLVTDSNYLYVANVKGLGSRAEPNYSTFHNVLDCRGTANKIPLPSAETLSKYTARVQENGRVPRMLQATVPGTRYKSSPVPVPAHYGEPSVFKHVLYVIKENKTYDQVFGDIPQGNGAPGLCVYPQFITPNHHALAKQYVLLDNFYCNGVLSMDGHSWATEGNSTDHFEKSFGGFGRSATQGIDALTYSSSGFIWNNVLSHGLSFRNFGVLANSGINPSSATWLQIYADYTNQLRQITFNQYIGIAPLIPYSSTNTPGFNFRIPDVVRADGFIKELNMAQSNGFWPTFTMLYLPSDHTTGSSPGFPTPQASVADNDLALGRVVEAVTKSIFASNTVIFVIEDDPQSGYDHVDGHRSLCLVISPYTKRGKTISNFYNQTGVLHTMEQIMGLPPMNQMDAMGPLMTECFTDTPDFTPYTALPSNIPLDTMNPGTLGSMSREERYWANKSLRLDFTKPDAADDNELNRIVWHSVKGNARYPSKWAGAHGRGLKKLGLALDRSRKDDDD
jgi:YVTN family beta-propeller protein